MGNFAEAGKIKDEMKKRDATRREKLAGYFFDLSKLIFAGMVIGLILPLLSDTENAKMWIIAVFGIILTTLSALLANKILNNGCLDFCICSRDCNHRRIVCLDIYEARKKMAGKLVRKQESEIWMQGSPH